MKTIQKLAVILIFSTLIPKLSTAWAQSHSIDWHTIDGGGGTSTGGSYALSGTIGQADAGHLTGGTYEVQGGFWPGMVIPSTGEVPTLLISWESGAVTVSWSPATAGFTLEATEDLTSGIWDAVPGGDTSPTVVPLDSATRFFRLIGP